VQSLYNRNRLSRRLRQLLLTDSNCFRQTNGMILNIAAWWLPHNNSDCRFTSLNRITTFTHMPPLNCLSRRLGRFLVRRLSRSLAKSTAA